jgi:hypothetical protein
MITSATCRVAVLAVFTSCLVGCIAKDADTHDRRDGTVGSSGSDQMTGATAAMGRVIAVDAACAASIDVVDSRPAKPGMIIDRKNPLTVGGWGAHDPEAGVANDSTFVSLVNLQTNEERIYATRKSPRTDVKIYLRHPDMGDLGYESTMLLSEATPGRYRVGIYVGWAGELIRCTSPQLEIVL